MAAAAAAVVVDQTTVLPVNKDAYTCNNKDLIVVENRILSKMIARVTKKSIRDLINTGPLSSKFYPTDATCYFSD